MESEQLEPIIVLITAPSLEVARRIAQALLEGRLAACVNLLPGVNSLYMWEGRLHDEQEVLMLVKTRAGLFKEGLLPVVKSLHPYKVPEIIALPVSAGLESYLRWIGEMTS
ncbi:MAG: divalent-cation tolerance protein CutA [Anaerolineales bacterium]|nr:divalent-cation tolerance protein CutA [Anaerolineales bacterium]